jgi:hypothetical protein
MRCLLNARRFVGAGAVAGKKLAVEIRGGTGRAQCHWQWLIGFILALTVAQASGESVTANFADSNGAVTADQYSGLVLITVTGSGTSLFGDLNDAFYLYTGPFSNAPHNDTANGYYQLEITKGSTVALNPADDAVNHIVYDVDAQTATTTPYLPAFRSDHTYSFIVDTNSIAGASLSTLRFGVDDGIYADNSGAYDIQVTAVPTPNVLAGGACILALLAAVKWTGRRSFS